MTNLTPALIDAAAAYRITRLLQTDTFPPAALLRGRIDERGGLLAEMYECPWCLGFWVSVAVVAARRLVPHLWGPIACALATSVVVGLMSERDADGETP